jgi:hypothetical protein
VDTRRWLSDTDQLFELPRLDNGLSGVVLPGLRQFSNLGAVVSKTNGYSHECWGKLKKEITAETNPENLPIVVTEINTLLDAVQERMTELT